MERTRAAATGVVITGNTMNLVCRTVDGNAAGVVEIFET
ncbi:hypothetical protein C731_1199 [Mycolicibacterium hassiacum DSM 44199]|uniref:Uncharacterized protein n=1 Tax=Mycolicibacterium hassiacum (strain DSM 44199 / CIP 105218 / JCM 12690 / 3849) TaxID=1122247 RepID=K5BGJ6_MYCHD|nr:hypothetical protein C731_1199 [Mycolicibacterium hassiacum DSM 44199]